MTILSSMQQRLNEVKMDPLQKLNDIKNRLAVFRTKIIFEKKEEGGYPPASSFSWGMRVAGEWVAGVFMGLALGYGVDHWLHVKPWGLIGGFILGIAAGFTNVYRVLFLSNAKKCKNENPIDREAE